MDTRILPQTIFTETETTAQYHDALRWLFSFATFQHKTADAYQASKLNLERMRAILGRLGNPHEKFQTVHIAGTKGKGSTAAICESILRAAGIRTGLYTSPHLHTFRERIRVGGEFISQAAIVEGINRLQAIQPDFPDAIVFELITALAFDYFARAGIEFAVLEVGLGGRLDATNVVTPRVSIITSISYDHIAILGDTLAQIAREKAGIIKSGIPVVSSPQADEARAVIEEVARGRGAELVQVSQDLRFQVAGHAFQVVGHNGSLESQRIELRESGSKPETFRQAQDKLCDLRLLGAHQLANAATALAAMKTLNARGVPISDASLRAGIQNARWQGRFEILEPAPKKESGVLASQKAAPDAAIHSKKYFIVDGAHNRDSARQLVATLDALFPNARVQWIFGASDDKDIRGMFAELVRRSGAFIVTRAPHPRASDPAVLAQWAREASAEPSAVETIAQAIALARTRVSKFDVTVVTGSLFVVAEARALILRARGEFIESDE